MCGIVAIAAHHAVMDHLLTGLKRLEYRGYDSAGMVIWDGIQLKRQRVSGKLQFLRDACTHNPLDGTTGIAHTRWATHGAPVESNAHPHMVGGVAVVHNGVIENFLELRRHLSEHGALFSSDTDTELVAHLISHHIRDGGTLQEAMQRSCCMLEGSFAIAVMAEHDPGAVWFATHGCPMVLGYGIDDDHAHGTSAQVHYGASDPYALLPFTRHVVDMHDGDIARITAEHMDMYRFDGTPITRPSRYIDAESHMAAHDGYAHFMLKEIYEQPHVVQRTSRHVRQLMHPMLSSLESTHLVERLIRAPYVICVACGTSYYAAMVAQYWFESIAGIRVMVDIASEYRYRNVTLAADTVVLCISQSGETADTVAALNHSKAMGAYVVGMVNVEYSYIGRHAHALILTQAGQEIGVASTKAFTTQLVALLELVMCCAQARGVMDPQQVSHLWQMIDDIPAKMEQTLSHVIASVHHVAHLVVRSGKVLYTGRHFMYPLALEGALKLKELSYLHAEAFASGELKHGPIALVDQTMPIIALVPKESVLFTKTISNIQEIAARGGCVIPVTSEAGYKALGHLASQAIEMPPCHDWLTPLLYAIPIQLIAYYTALEKGTDIDQPRNLAKSVTVE